MTTNDTTPDTIEISVTLDDSATTPTTAPNAEQSREDWLRAALHLIHGTAYTMPVSYGFGKGGTRSAKGYSIHNDAKDQPQLFIHPTTREPVALVARLFAATVSAYHTHQIPEIAAQLPPFPTDGLAPTTTENKDGIRQIKCHCPACGFTFRTSAKWIAKGLPICACGTKTKTA